MTQLELLKSATRLSVIYAVAFCATIVATLILLDGIVLTEDGVVGGDFLAFYTAGTFASAGDALAAYDFNAFDAKLKELAPLEHLGMMWQYPPAMFFVLAPFALLPYKVSFAVWCGLGWTALLLALRTLDFRGYSLLALAFSPLCVTVIDNGQISLATTALLILSAYDPKQRWLMAGLAAGLLTLKPQLGILLPIAYLMCGAWRTIFVAALTAMVLHSVSLIVFGVEGWRDFLFAVARLNADVTSAGLHTPPEGMTTLFGQLRMLGAPSSFAVPTQYTFSVMIVITVALVWRRSSDTLGKAAMVCAGAILATPYAYGYEMAALVLPAVYLARGVSSVRSPMALYLIGSGVVLALSPVMSSSWIIQAPFVISVSAFGLVLYSLLQTKAPAPASSQFSGRATPSVAGLS
jgi:hypothetical protein